MRTMRKSQAVRDLAAETRLCGEDMIFPYFVVPGSKVKKPITSMPGLSYLSADEVVKDLSLERRLKAILLFGANGKKDALASESHDPEGAVQKAVRAIKKEFDDVAVITDVCLCGYTKHGHCGILKGKEVNNSLTLSALAKAALSHAEAGADLVAPSAMADGQVAAIRKALDGKGFATTGILAYSAKYASNFYGPFRDALASVPGFGDRSSYQMDFRNSAEAVREISADIREGADMVMVKPALAYLDIIRLARERFDVPLAAYNVSGEYSMIKLAAAGDIQAEKGMALEVLTSIKRAGADVIITYFAKEAMKWIG